MSSSSCGRGCSPGFRRELESRLLVAHGTVSRWDGTTNVIVSRLERLQTRAPLPSSHDRR